MKRCSVLAASWSLLVILLCSSVAKSDAPDCKSCWCAEADAWAVIGGDKTFVYALKNEDGDVVSTSSSKILATIDVQALNCQDKIVKEEAGYKLYQYNPIWEPSCKKKTDIAAYFHATMYSKDWKATDEGTKDKRRWCGPNPKVGEEGTPLP
jgi:hypothetical protein